jgi:hypothetical protein
MVSIKLRASEYWSKVIKRRQVRDPRLRGIVRKQTALLHPEMTLANPASKQGRAEVAPNDPIYPPFSSNRSPGNFAADPTILDVYCRPTGCDRAAAACGSFTQLIRREERVRSISAPSSASTSGSDSATRTASAN